MPADPAPASPVGWRPSPRIRAVAIGLIRNTAGAELLMPVHRDDGGVKGYRPLGGAIEFGERAEAALHREFREELDRSLSDVRLLGVMENLYTHEGAPGHEIIFAFRATLEGGDDSTRPLSALIEGGRTLPIVWLPPAALTPDAPLLPRGLEALVNR